jgi:hypothetical protein
LELDHAKIESRQSQLLLLAFFGVAFGCSGAWFFGGNCACFSFMFILKAFAFVLRIDNQLI